MSGAAVGGTDGASSGRATALLLGVSALWALSFGLIKHVLGGVDPAVLSTLRLGLAGLALLPFLRPAGLGAARTLQLLGIGAVQFGVMYLAYLAAFAHLRAYEVALYTITTPLLVALLDALLERRLRAAHALGALLAVGGAAVTLAHALPGSGLRTGFALVQVSNLCFAAGQVAWRRVRRGPLRDRPDISLFALPYGGAFVLAAAYAALSHRWTGGLAGPLQALSPGQLATVALLGIVSSGAGFCLWNAAAVRVNAGVLAVLNNAKIPLALACSLAVWGEGGAWSDWARALGGAALTGAGVWVASRGAAGPAP